MVNVSVVRRLADVRSFERGQRYFAARRVRSLTVRAKAGQGTTVLATVAGNDVYEVRLVVGARSLRGQCSCPYGAEGVFCKHCVAAALTWLESDVPASGARVRVVATAAQTRKRLERAIRVRGGVSYTEAYAYFQDVAEALDDVEALVGGDAAITLAEYALELLESAAGRIDDSDGGLMEALFRAQEIHLAACAASRPDPVALAERLAAAGMSSGYGVFLDALPTYAEVLGEPGLARYREVVEQRWRRLPPKQPGDFGGSRFTVVRLMENVAKTLDGTDALVEVMARDVTAGYEVLRIAEVLVADGRDEEALGWLERGLAEYPPDRRLRALAADVHLRAGRRDRAAELRWENLVELPGADTYHALRATDDSPAWRDRARAHLAGLAPVWRSALIDVLLAEGEPEAAWQAAVDGGCTDQHWLRLARVRAETHPADAIPVLARAAEQAIRFGKRDSYRVAARLLAEARVLATRCRQDDDFRDRLAALRETHRRKPALLEELDRVRLP